MKRKAYIKAEPGPVEVTIKVETVGNDMVALRVSTNAEGGWLYMSSQMGLRTLREGEQFTVAVEEVQE